VLRADWLLFSDRTLPTSADVFSGTHTGRGEPDDGSLTEEADADA
jgi:hypothetical protein